MTKALFFDVDGTLIDGKHGIRAVPDAVVGELHRLQRLGHRVFVSSGRPYPMITQDFFDIGFDGYVLGNGGHVLIEGVSVYEELMGGEAARAAADLLERMACEYTIDTAHHVYLNPAYHGLEHFFRHHDGLFTYEFDRDEVLERALKLEAYPADDERELIRARAAAEIGPSVFCGDNGTGMTFEMYAPTLSKVTGVRMALEHYGLGFEDAYAFGDGVNDLQMLVTCGVGVAMGNAVPEVKAAADLVCGTVTEGGLARVLRELFP